MSTFIQLGDISSVISFDDVADDYSNASGNRIQRRKERKLDRIAARDEVKTARKQTRIGRKKNKKLAKIDKRTSVQQARIGKRTAGMQARQEKKTLKQQLINERRELTGDESGLPTDETTDNNTIGGYGYDNGGEGGGGGYDENNGGYNDGGSNGQNNGYGYGEEEDYGNEGNVDGGGGGADYSGGEDGGGQGEEYEAEDGGIESYPFDGEQDDFIDDSSNADGESIEVKPELQGIADKIEWNKELVSRLNVKKAQIAGMEGMNTDMHALNDQIDERNARIVQLQNVLNKYSNYEGEFTDNSENFTEYLNADGKAKRTPAERKKLVKQIKKALHNAKQKRRGIKRRATVVDNTLEPVFEEQRIVVPASSNFEGATVGTGITALDASNDYDAGTPIQVELKSGFDGSLKQINWTGVVIGVGVAGLAIWAINKYKLFA